MGEDQSPRKKMDLKLARSMTLEHARKGLEEGRELLKALRIRMAAGEKVDASYAERLESAIARLEQIVADKSS